MLNEDMSQDIIESLDSEYIYMEMFRAFDIEGSGFIDRADLYVAAKAMGWKDQ